ncbi:MAG TPA: hypothetical protein VFY04_03740 [Solirubrobacterales bacterium]|nr:hypothetical protein [Solirubrobacterales bacterium]
MLAVGVAAIANAASTTIRVGNLVLTFGGNFSPKKLPKNKYAPITSNIFGTIKTSDSTHPSAFREAHVDITNVKVDTKGIPVCKASQLQARDTKAAKRVCGKATIGSGLAHAEIAFPEQRPINVPSPITVFNGGTKGGKTKLLIHTFITVPVPAAIVTDVTIKKKGSGISTISKIPVIAGGSGSVLDFKFTVSKKVVSAKCPNGKIEANAKAIFKNEAGTPGVAATTTAKGKVLVPCKPKG